MFISIEEAVNGWVFTVYAKGDVYKETTETLDDTLKAIKDIVAKICK